MIASTTPRQDVQAAFKTLLDSAGLGVKVYERHPNEGVESRSVVLTIFGGPSSKPAIGLTIGHNMRGVKENYRLQVDCYHNNPTNAEQLADIIVQTIMDHRDVLKTRYGIEDLKKVLDIPAPPEDPMLREFRIILDFTFNIHRAVT